MERYATTLEHGVLAIEGDDDALVIGEMDDLVDLIGGETYTIEYDEDAAAMAQWLDVDEDATLTIDVRETLSEMDFPQTFFSELAQRDGGESPSERTEYFADIMQDIWDQRGNLDDEDNPFV